MASGPLDEVVPDYRRDGKNLEANKYQGIHNYPRRQQLVFIHHSGFSAFIRVSR